MSFEPITINEMEEAEVSKKARRREEEGKDSATRNRRGKKSSTGTVVYIDHSEKPKRKLPTLQQCGLIQFRVS